MRTWMTSFIKALSVDILAFFITETLGPTQVTSTNLARLLISSPVWKKEFMVKKPRYWKWNIIWEEENHFLKINTTYLNTNVTKSPVIIAKVWLEIDEFFSCSSDSEMILFIKFEHSPEKERRNWQYLEIMKFFLNHLQDWN